MRPLLAVAILLVAGTGGCLDWFDRAVTQHDVQRSAIDREGWNTGGSFAVQVLDPEPVEVRITGTSADGRTIQATGTSGAGLPAVEVTVPDGTWTLSYFLEGTKWQSWSGLRFDATPPQITGLPAVAQAGPNGDHLLGASAVVTGASRIDVREQRTGQVVGSSLPVQLRGLPDGAHAYDIVASDEAGNTALEQVQVLVGDAARMPAGKHTLGLVARYTLDTRIWDIAALGTWATPAQAQSAVGGDWLGSGLAITPDDPAVRDVVEAVVPAGSTTGQAAFALFRWMMDNLEYDDTRLDRDGILTPRQTLLDREHPTQTPDEDTGLVADGEGNGQRGGVCRDLAATYVSLLRAAGIPASLVTGYLAGQVNGFHAWAEFYAGPGHGPSPWVPVDVSPLDGPFDVQVALQAFGMQHTDMLPLQVVSEEQEDEPWSIALSVATRYPRPGPEPDVQLAKSLDTRFRTPGTLCVNNETLARVLLSAPQANCGGAYTHRIPTFVRTAQHILDYGAKVVGAGDGTEVTVTVTLPMEPTETVQYGASFVAKAGAGQATGTWEA